MAVVSGPARLTPGALADHVALPRVRPEGRALVRLNMISSADGAASVGGLSGGLGARGDRAVFAALRDSADTVLVAMRTAVAERYSVPPRPGLSLWVVSSRPDISGNPGLFATGQSTLVLPEDAGPAPEGVATLRLGHGSVDLRAVAGALAGRVLLVEGGPTLAGAMVAEGLVDEFFLTVSPRLVAGASGRSVHGDDADPGPWTLERCTVDDDGYLFLRYGRPARTGG